MTSTWRSLFASTFTKARGTFSPSLHIYKSLRISNKLHLPPSFLGDGPSLFEMGFRLSDSSIVTPLLILLLLLLLLLLHSRAAAPESLCTAPLCTLPHERACHRFESKYWIWNRSTFDADLICSVHRVLPPPSKSRRHSTPSSKSPLDASLL